MPGIQLDVLDLARFVAWLEDARRSDEQGRPLADPPAFRDDTVSAWARMIAGLAARAASLGAGLGRAEDSIDRQAAQLRDQTLQLAEHLAAVYECCERDDEARSIRLRAAGLSLQAPSGREDLSPPRPRSGQSP